MVYEGTWNAEDSQYEFNVTALKVFQDMQAGKLTVLNIEVDGSPYSLLLDAGYANTVEEVTYFEFFADPTVMASLNIDTIIDDPEGNLVIVIQK